MSGQGPRTVVILTLLAIGLGGCQSNSAKNQRLSQEREELWQRYQQLQATTTQYSDYYEQQRNETIRLQQENAQLQMQLKNARQTRDEPAVAANVAFSTVEGVEVIRTHNRVTVRLPGDVLFQPGDTTLKSTARKTLDHVAAEIKRQYPTQPIRVEGYTDTDKIRKSSWKDNLELSLQRAASVHRYLVSRGISPQRMYAAGFGESKPRATKSKSRRVEIVVVLDE